MDSFVDGSGYLAACTAGLPTHGTLAAMRADLDAWGRAASSPITYGALVEEGRALFARIVGVDPSRVATGSQTSAMVAVAAAALPDGAEVVVPDGDFSSVVFPFHAQAYRGVRSGASRSPGSPTRCVPAPRWSRGPPCSRRAARSPTRSPSSPRHAPSGRSPCAT
ncbi:hypothetical protein [Curtobacterium sp. 'Ferrero']|uniref:hypothetical protein n=1 Tax=Curtobacterium sp. 'Ferrero' TaxID=2033654 RepID=UPI0020D0DD5A|nr:hypothetical protein [Curtobacterium sp. 'Ferrero']